MAGALLAIPLPEMPVVLPVCVPGGGAPPPGNPCWLDFFGDCVQYCDHPKPQVAAGVMECTAPAVGECVGPYIPPTVGCVCAPPNEFIQNTLSRPMNVRCYESCTCTAENYENPFIDCAPCGTLPPGCKCDPHFVTLYGAHQFDFMGKAETTFNIISSETVQLNAGFIDSIHHAAIVNHHEHNLNTTKTFLGSIGFQTGNDQISIDAEECIPSFNGQIMANTDGGSDFLHFSHRMVQDPEEEKDVAHLTIRSADWDILISCEWLAPEHKREKRFLNFEVSYHPEEGARIPDGVLGQTAEEREYKSNAWAHQGEGIIKGDWQDYIVKENDLFGTHYRYKQFNARNAPHPL